MNQIILLLIVLFVVSCQTTNNKQQTSEEAVAVEVTETTFRVEGMTCTHCEQSIAKGVNELEGIVFVNASHNDSVATVKFDKSKTNEAEIIRQIEKRGYKVKGKI